MPTARPLVALTCAPLVLMLVAVPSPGRAGETPAQKCSVAKLKAAFKKTGKKGVCFEKAIAKAASVDPTCLGNADTAFGLAFQKAEAKGGCLIPGDATPVEATVDTCVTSVVNEITGVTTTPTSTTTSTTIACSPPCATGMCCSGVCTDTSSDPFDCGSCGHQCLPGETCVGSQCTCSPPNTFCGTQCNVRPCSCSDLQTDSSNCGVCGNRCPVGTDCQGGTCVKTCCDDVDCRVGYEFCCSYSDHSVLQFCPYPRHCASAFPPVPPYPLPGTLLCVRSSQCAATSAGDSSGCITQNLGGPPSAFCLAFLAEASCTGVNVP
jgi:hypothetical protein